MTFLYGNENPSRKNFFYTAAIRLMVCYPVVAVMSVSAADIFSILIFLFWILSGHWKDRWTLLKESPLILAAIPIIVWTFSGVFRDFLVSGDYRIFFDSLRYWWGHFLFFFAFILATLLCQKGVCQKEIRSAILSSINLAMILIWILVILFGTDLLPASCRIIHISSIHFYRNTIYFGMGLVLWAGLWICTPFTLKDIPLIRRFLPRRVLLGMKRATQISPLNLLLHHRDRLFFETAFFLLLRWGVVVFIGYYLFWINPSRTGQLALLVAASTVFVCWNWKKGIPLAVVLCVCVPFAAHYSSPVFLKKAIETINDTQTFTADVSQGKETLRSDSRLTIWKKTFALICEKPIIGYGMERGRKEVLTKTKYNHPHNEFIYITLEFGVIGLTCFLFWLGILVYRTITQPLQWRCFGFFVIVVLFIDSMTNCALSYDQEAHLFLVLIAILFAMDRKQQKTR
jgi:O-antigen ligase